MSRSAVVSHKKPAILNESEESRGIKIRPVEMGLGPALSYLAQGVGFVRRCSEYYRQPVPLLKPISELGELSFFPLLGKKGCSGRNQDIVVEPDAAAPKPVSHSIVRERIDHQGAPRFIRNGKSEPSKKRQLVFNRVKMAALPDLRSRGDPDVVRPCRT